MPISEGAWHRLHPALIALGLLAALRQILLLLALGFLAARSAHLDFLLLTTLFLLPPLLRVAALWLGTLYRCNEGHIEIQEGILSRRNRQVPISKIQNIKKSQSFAARLLGVVELELETAGSQKAEALFPALSPHQAKAIEDFIQGQRSEEGKLTQDEERTLFHLDLKGVMLAGATANRMGLIMALLFLAYRSFEERILLLAPAFLSEALGQIHQLGPASLARLLLLSLLALSSLLLLAWMIGVASALLRFHNFTLSRDPSSLRLRSGLLTRTESRIELDRIQAITGHASLQRRLFGSYEMLVQTAAVAVDERNRPTQAMLAPLVHRQRLGQLLSSIFPATQWQEIAWHKVHPWSRAKQFRILGACGLPAIVLLSQLALPPATLPLWWLGLLAAAWLAFSFWVATTTYRQTAYAIDSQFLYIRSGFLALSFFVIPLARIQLAALTQSPFQRRKGLANLRIDVAGSSRMPAEIPCLPLADAWRLFNQAVAGDGRRTGCAPETKENHYE
jgi:putative membrane protein